MKTKNKNFHSLPPENVLRRVCVCLAQADWIDADVYWTNDGERGWAIAIAFHRNNKGEVVAKLLEKDLKTCADSHRVKHYIAKEKSARRPAKPKQKGGRRAPR